MDTERFFSVLSSQMITLKERDDGNRKKQGVAKEASFPHV